MDMSDKLELQQEFLRRIAPLVGFDPDDTQHVAEVFGAINLIVRNNTELRRYVENADTIDSLIEEYCITELIL